MIKRKVENKNISSEPKYKKEKKENHSNNISVTHSIDITLSINKATHYIKCRTVTQGRY